MKGRDLVLLIGVTSFVGGGAVLAPVPATLAFVVVLLLLRVRSLVSIVGGALLTIVFVAAALRGLVEEADARHTYEVARSLASPPAWCELEAEVVSSPQARAELERAAIEISKGTCAGREIPEGTRLDLRTTHTGLGRGDVVRARGRFAPIYLFEDPDLPAAWTRVARTGTALSGTTDNVEVVSRGFGVKRAIDYARGHVRARIRQTYHPDAEALGRALVLGETDLEAEPAEAFRATGLSHILAVSGTHLVVCVLAVTGILRALLVRVALIARRHDAGRIVAAIAIPFTWLYTDFAGGSGSVVRAAAMMTAVLGARMLGRRASAARSMAAAILLGVAFDPVVLADISFTLSTAATCGLLVLQRPIASIIGIREEVDVDAEPAPKSTLRKAWGVVGGAVAATLAATIACAPVTALLSPELPLAGILANLIAAPLGEVFALPFAAAHAVMAPLPWPERGAAFVASGALRGVLQIARIARDLGVTLPVPATTAHHVAVLGVGAVWIATSRRVTGKLASVAAMGLALAAVEIGVRRAERPKGTLTVTALDVGQGDALLVDFPDGSLMVIDAGGFPGQSFDVGERVVAPVLRARRRSRIDWLLLSHPHPDHYGGMGAVLKKMESVGEVWDNGHAAAHGNAAVTGFIDAASEKGARVLTLDELCAGPRELGGAIVEVLAPCPSLHEGDSVNDGSLVVKITYGERSVLLMGDAEKDAEERLLAERPEALRADLLKVGHHGSRTSTTLDFALAVAPEHAVISCGVRNNFGHPNLETLDTLEAVGASVARTDIGGSWSWSTDGVGVQVSR